MARKLSASLSLCRITGKKDVFSEESHDRLIWITTIAILS
jgi:hypothetical protein